MIQHKFEKIALKLLNIKKCNINYYDKDGNTALILACKNNNDTNSVALKLLNMKECNIGHINKDGEYVETYYE
jgi:ankyrin repeat protein